jgi:two-component system NarL family sensor kinase
VTEQVDLQTGWVWLLDAETGRFYRAATQNLPEYLQAPVRMTGTPCWCLEAFRDGQLTPSNVGMMHCSRLLPAVRKHQSKLAWHASIPLYIGAEPLGVMNVTAPAGRRLSDEELQFLSIVGYQVGLALARFRLAEEAARLARVEERTAAARTIHDTLAQGLTGIVLHAESALEAADRAVADQRLRVILETARQNLEEARASVVSLRAGALRGQPLAEALARLARAFTSRTGVPVRVMGSAHWTVEIETELYAIVQEALNNIEKHAAAHHVSVRMEPGKVIVEDDGTGFERRRVKAGHGWVGMRERARLIGARLTVRGRPGQGTSVVVSR